MNKEKAIEYIKRAMDCIDELPFSDNGMLAFYDLEIALKELEDWVWYKSRHGRTKSEF